MKNDFFVVKFLKKVLKNLINFFLCFKRPDIIKIDNVTYIAHWKRFRENTYFFHQIFKNYNQPIKVLGPFHHRLKCRKILDKIIGWPHGRADFFITGEAGDPLFDYAEKQIGYWRNIKNNKNIFRFPAWMWYLDWKEFDEKTYNSSWYYGMRLSIDKLMRPILDSYSYESIKNRKKKSILITSHFKNKRKELFDIVNSTIGCDGLGKAFGNRDFRQLKMPLLEKYNYNLCPENEIYDGYITEKIPDAFHAGCIPISWCNPSDLEEDFNSEAVVNLFGLDNLQRKEVLTELSSYGEMFEKLLKVPLLKKKPKIEPLIQFLNNENNFKSSS